MKKLEVGKSYKTNHGKQVRIYAVDGSNGQPVHGAVLNESGQWDCHTWGLQGQFLKGATSVFDVIIPTLKYEGEATVMGFGDGINSTIFVPSEFSGLKVKFTLEV